MRECLQQGIGEGSAGMEIVRRTRAERAACTPAHPFSGIKGYASVRTNKAVYVCARQSRAVQQSGLVHVRMPMCARCNTE